jgi:DNA-binding MarR family transcriptional regulator
MINGLDDSIGYLSRIIYWKLKPFQISVGQYVILRSLAEHKAVSQHHIGANLRICEPTVALALRKLEDMDLVYREKNSTNRREMLVHLTESGRLARRCLSGTSRELNEAATRGMSPTEVFALFSLLRRAAHNLLSE